MNQDNKISTILKWVTGGLELFWGLPFIGGMIIVSLAWTPLALMLILHIITLVFSSKENKKIYGSVLGIVTSVVAIIPFVGMVMHIITGILLLVDANNQQKQQNNKDISITSNNQEIN